MRRILEKHLTFIVAYFGPASDTLKFIKKMHLSFRIPLSHVTSDRSEGATTDRQYTCDVIVTKHGNCHHYLWEWREAVGYGFEGSLQCYPIKHSKQMH